MSYSSNIDAIGEALDALVAGFNFTLPGKDQSLGRDLAGIAAQGVIDRTVADQQTIDGSPLQPNSAVYAAFKAKAYRTYQPGLRTGQMLSLQSVMGDTQIDADSVTMKYGIDAVPSSSSTGYISDADQKVTDRQKAEYFSGDRPFYGLDSKIAQNITTEAQSALDDYVSSGQ